MTENDDDHIEDSRFKKLHVDVKNSVQTPITSPVKSIYSQISKVYEKAVSLKFLHSYSAGVCNFRNKVIQFPARLISSLVGTGSAMNLITNHSTFTTADYILSILTIIGSILSIADSFADYSTRELKHNHFKAQLIELTNNIEYTLALPPESNVNYEDFLQKITQKLTYLSNGGSPPFVGKAERKLSILLNGIGEKDFERPIAVHKLKTSNTPPKSPLRIM